MYNLIIILFIVISVKTLNSALAASCKPEISEGSHSKLTEEGHTSLECDISTCNGVAKIVYELIKDDASTEWIPVFEGITKSVFRSLNSSDDYSRNHRYMYTAFLTKHILYIKPLILQDQGKWRCIVYGLDYKEFPSMPLELYLAPTCKPRISEGSHSALQLYGHTSLECDISTCGYGLKVIYEKTSLDLPNTWIKVVRGRTKENFQALDTGSNGYFLRNRIEYTAFPTHHILYISNLTKIDQGEWRCVAINQKKILAQSQALTLGLVSPCKPTISEGSHSKLQLQGHTSLECDISTCGSVSKIIYEKKGINFRTPWIAVYEGTNKTHSKYVDIGNNEYSLEPRVQYGAFQTHHIVYISDLILKDQGKWRCVITDENNKQTESNTFELKLELCSPKITEGEGSHSEKGGALVLQCVLKACFNIAKVVFEKADNQSSTDWTSLYEGIDDAHHRPTITGDGYDLNRTKVEYSALSVSHTLVIKPLILKDQGYWRCKVYDDDNIGYESEELEVYIYVTPSKDNIIIKSDHPRIFTDQTANFTCTADGIHPEPIVVWKVNGRELNTGKPHNTKDAYGIFTIKNSISLSFGSIGIVYISCKMRTDRKQFWIEKEMTFSVKQSAKVLLPTDTYPVQLKTDEIFTLNCIGIGYKPNITWMHNKQPFRRDNFTFKHNCTKRQCASSLSSRLLHQTMLCSDVLMYIGEYVCTVYLESPYQMEPVATSPILKVNGFASTSTKLHIGKCNRNVDVRCDICSSGGSMIVWEFDGERINYNKDSYYIGEMKSQHFGNYTKIVLNNQWNVSCSVAVMHEESKDQYCIWEITVFGGIFPTLVIVITVFILWWKPGHLLAFCTDCPPLFGQSRNNQDQEPAEEQEALHNNQSNDTITGPSEQNLGNQESSV